VAAATSIEAGFSAFLLGLSLIKFVAMILTNRKPLPSCGTTVRGKTIFNPTVYFITLNSNCEAQTASKKLKKNCRR